MGEADEAAGEAAGEAVAGVLAGEVAGGASGVVAVVALPADAVALQEVSRCAIEHLRTMSCCTHTRVMLDRSWRQILDLCPCPSPPC